MNEQLYLGGAPAVGFGFGQVAAPVVAPVAAAPSPWTLALATSVFSAATGWVLEEFVTSRRRRRRR